MTFKPKTSAPGTFTLEPTSCGWWRAEWTHENSNFHFISPKPTRAMEIVEAHAEQIAGYNSKHKSV